MRVMELRVRMRRALMATLASFVLAAAAVIPMAVFATPVPSVSATASREGGGRIPWELSGAVWSECPMGFQAPGGLAVGWGTDGLGEWTVSLWDEHGNETPEDELALEFPELVEPFRSFHECLDRFPTTPYSEPRTLTPAQLEMYWEYALTELAPCLRDHGYEVFLPPHQTFRSTDTATWYLEQIHAWDGSVPLDELLTVWAACPIYPSYLDAVSTDGASWELRQAG